MSPEDALEKLAAGEITEELISAAVPEIERLAKFYLILLRVSGELQEELAQRAVVFVYRQRERFFGRGLPAFKARLRVKCRWLWMDETIRRRAHAGGDFGSDGPDAAERSGHGRVWRAGSAARAPEGQSDPPSERFRMLRELDSLIEKLDATDRAILEARERLGLPWESIAAEIGLSIRACQRRLALVKTDLRDSLRRKGFELT